MKNVRKKWDTIGDINIYVEKPGINQDMTELGWRVKQRPGTQDLTSHVQKPGLYRAMGNF